ncbi:MAG: hypothetical protein ACKO9B_12400, partial [Planctomycetota bacterium]
DALPEIAYHSTHRGLAILGDGHATARTSRRSCRGVFRNRFYPQILLRRLKKKGKELVFRVPSDIGERLERLVNTDR